MEAHIYVKSGVKVPYQTETTQSAHILAIPLLHITFPIGLSLDQAIANATAVTITTGMEEIAQERNYIETIKNGTDYTGARPINQVSVGSIKLADDQLKTEKDPEKRQQAQQRRNIALAQIVTQFHEYFSN